MLILGILGLLVLYTVGELKNYTFLFIIYNIYYILQLIFDYEVSFNLFKSVAPYAALICFIIAIVLQVKDTNEDNENSFELTSFLTGLSFYFIICFAISFFLYIFAYYAIMYHYYLYEAAEFCVHRTGIAKEELQRCIEEYYR